MRSFHRPFWADILAHAYPDPGSGAFARARPAADRDFS